MEANSHLSAQDIVLILTAVGTLVTVALVPSAVLLVKTIKDAVKELIVAFQQQNITLDQIHKLTNSQHTTSLQLVADSASKTARTTGDPDDIALSVSAEKALELAKEATLITETKTTDTKA